MKSNDNGVPRDELLLAEAIAAAEANGLRHTTHALFRSRIGTELNGPFRHAPASATRCCAYGALIAAGVVPGTFINRPRYLDEIALGNDYGEPTWYGDKRNDNGESLGWAFRCAMTQEEG